MTATHASDRPETRAASTIVSRVVAAGRRVSRPAGNQTLMIRIIAGCGIPGTHTIYRRINAFFAISMNSPSMSMVNFYRSVFFAPNALAHGLAYVLAHGLAHGLARKVAPQPRCAIRMEAGDHARL